MIRTGAPAVAGVPGAPHRRGLAAIALVAIIAITVAWWTLALYPAGPAAPAWLARTQAACFGTTANGLPSVAGWIVLIGEPLGMVALLLVVWRDALRDDLRWLLRRPWGRIACTATAFLVAAGVGIAVQRVRAALGLVGEPFNPQAGFVAMERPGTVAPPINLVDQDGQRFDLADARGGRVMVTFAFAHCADVCPTVVQDLRAARRDAGATDVPLVVVTLDPWRDVPARLPHMAAQWNLEPGDRVLSGTVDEVTQALDAWGIARSRDTTTGEVGHATVAVLVDEEGKIAARVTGQVRELEAALRGGGG